VDLIQMTDLPLDQSVPLLVAIALVHLAAGAALGKWFRFGVLLPAFAVVLVESLVGGLRLGLGRWYVLLIAGVILVQLGYAAAARLRPVSQAEHHPGDHPGSIRGASAGD
jgi:hypothetical protein